MFIQSYKNNLNTHKISVYESMKASGILAINVDWLSTPPIQYHINYQIEKGRDKKLKLSWLLLALTPLVIIILVLQIYILLVPFCLQSSQTVDIRTLPSRWIWSSTLERGTPFLVLLGPRNFGSGYRGILLTVSWTEFWENFLTNFSTLVTWFNNIFYKIWNIRNWSKARQSTCWLIWVCSVNSVKLTFPWFIL